MLTISSAGRDHLAYRSAYAPVKAVNDGDLCESYRRLPQAKQAMIASELDRSVQEVLKKLCVFSASSSFFLSSSIRLTPSTLHRDGAIAGAW